MTRQIFVYYGDDKSFQQLIEKEVSPDDEGVTLLDTIRRYNAQIRSSDVIAPDMEMLAKGGADYCVVKTNDYGSILEHAVNNFAEMISHAYEVDTIFLQNPPIRVVKSVESAYPNIVDIKYQKYPKLTKRKLKRLNDDLQEKVLGQQEGKREILLALYKLALSANTKPVAILLYGPSGVGKTETARSLSERLGGKLTRVQMSMMHTTEAYEYVFGAEHSKSSFARDLLGRESNVVLLDEFDKVNPNLYNAFYQLFDEGIFVYPNYEVNMHGALFVLTSNFSSEKEIKDKLGGAMYSRIGACVEYKDLAVEDKARIAEQSYEKIIQGLDKDDKREIESTDINEWFHANAGRYNNMRIMKTKMERAIFGHLVDELLNE